MNCGNCERKQRQFYCENCLREHLRDKRARIQLASSERDEHITKASRALEVMRPTTLRRADVVRQQQAVDVVLEGLEQLRKKNEATKERIQTLQRSLSSRRVTLATAKSTFIGATPALNGLPPPPTFLESNISKDSQQLAALSDTITRARVGLIQELVEVFDVVQVGGRPAVGGMKGAKGEWSIGGLILPVPGDVRRYPSQYINAAVTHTIHFINLLSFYLGVKLPFEIQWTGNGLGVGAPMIGASSGADSGGWSKWSKKHPLQLSSDQSGPATSSPIPTNAISTGQDLRSSVSISPESPVDSSILHSKMMSASTTPVMVEHPTTLMEPNYSGDLANDSFTTAFAMLLYNVCYLAYTQSVDIPLSQAGDALSNLWAVCCSSDLGRRSHATTPILPPPTPQTFPLDFPQLLQATTASPTRLRPIKSSKRHGKRRGSTIVEEEEGWDLMNDVAA
ncbi:UV radiation resistance protein/autophagy-related protein 14 [Thelephora terrestris]|uniref:Autophagy-related protein 14 n=1 Tax=Thelephora terrestris TaxID=56493 RepID=A0A9P6L8Y2_9AGAM|nr:UV radiation resistance protein/autophagy-related protein 14 [Thelephora terrestris]